MPTAVLARLAGGVLDLASHRLDAWVSAQATRRLATLRTRRPLGVRLGGYGVLENVRPATTAQAASHGYIHAPSLGQATTAAVLRSGHLAHAGEPGQPLALDLSSRRVRLALALLDGVRAGQPLGALLGYRLERGLHEGHPGLALDRYIAALRALAPLDAITAAEHDLSVASARQLQAGQVLGQLRQQSETAKAADTVLRNQIATAQPELDAAQANAARLSAGLQAARTELQFLLDPSPRRLPRDPDLARPGRGGGARRSRASSLRSRPRTRRSPTPLRVSARSAGSSRPPRRRSPRSTSRSPISWPRSRRPTPPSPPPVPCWRNCAPASRACRRPCERATSPTGSACAAAGALGVAAARWDDTTIPFGNAAAGLPALSSPEGQAIDAELRALDDAVDALADLLVAESVHQLVQGNAQRAGATVDALSRGDAPPPDVEVVRTPRAGTAVTHRLLVLADPAAPAAGWPTDATQVRAKVEPALEAWAGSVLGPASRVLVRARYTSPAGAVTPSATDLSVLRLSALDALAMTPAGGPAGATEIELALLDRFAAVRPAGVSADATPELVLERDPAWTPAQLGLAEFLELARAVRELLEGARPLDARDLALPSVTTNPGIDAADLAARTAIATRALQDTRAQLSAALGGGQAAALRSALARAAKLGVTAPPEAARAALEDLDRRTAAVAAASSDNDARRRRARRRLPPAAARDGGRRR